MTTVRRPPWPGPRRIAHRGGGTFAPENTLAAMREAVARSYRGVEFDVMLTADGMPVLMHDARFGRTVAGVGAVATTDFATLARLDAGAWFGPAYVGERVPRYDEVVHFCVAHDVWMNVEIKPAPGFERETGRVVGERTMALLPHAHERARRLLFSSFSIAALDAARAAAPDVPRGLLFDAVPGDAGDRAEASGCISVHADHRALDAVSIDRLRSAGFAVLAYTVDDPSRVQALVDAGVDAIVTDRLDLVAPD